MSEDKCTSCDTAATFKLPDNSYGCKCTYEFEVGQTHNESVAVLPDVKMSDPSDSVGR